MPDPIKHVVLLMLENHSFDQMLGCFNSVYPDLEGIDPQSLRTNKDKDGVSFTQQETDELQVALDPKHEQKNVLDQLVGCNAGFVLDFSTEYPESTTVDRQEIMGFYGMGKLPALHALAADFTICDHWFSSLPGPTWPNRFFALSGTSSGEVEMPSGAQQANPLWYLHQRQHTVFDRLHEQQRKWKVYYYDFPNSWLFLRQLLPQNIKNYHHIDTFFNEDVLDEGSFPDFVFIEPKYFGQDQNDDHPPHNVMKAEKLVADVYNAIRSNPELWESTLLVITFDEHGGFYDHIVPPKTVAPDENVSNYAFDQLGVRVPALFVSPWVGKRVEHTAFDHTSLLKYLTNKWHLGDLGKRTASETTNSIDCCLTEQQPRKDTIPFIRVPYKELIPTYPEREKDTNNENQKSIHLFARQMELETQKPEFAQAFKAPGWMTKLKHTAGTVITKIGQSLTKEHETMQKARLTRLETLVKSAKNTSNDKGFFTTQNK